MLESLRYSGLLVCNVMSSLGSVFFTMRSFAAFRGMRVQCGPDCLPLARRTQTARDRFPHDFLSAPVIFSEILPQGYSPTLTKLLEVMLSSPCHDHQTPARCPYYGEPFTCGTSGLRFARLDNDRQAWYYFMWKVMENRVWNLLLL
jgi:hypothetical protein